MARPFLLIALALGYACVGPAPTETIQEERRSADGRYVLQRVQIDVHGGATVGYYTELRLKPAASRDAPTTLVSAYGGSATARWDTPRRAILSLDPCGLMRGRIRFVGPHAANHRWEDVDLHVESRRSIPCPTQ
jgi:hypothetical protein